MLKCKNCGKKVDKASKLCPGCGKSPGNAARNGKSKKHMKKGQATSADGQRKKIVLFAIAAVVVLAVGVYFLFFGANDRAIVGSWELVGIEGMAAEEFEELVNWIGTIQVQFNRNSTGFWLYSVGTLYEERVDFAWETTGNTVVITEDGPRAPLELLFTVTDSQLVLTENGDVSIFSRR